MNYPVFGAIFPLGTLSGVADFTDNRAVFGDFDGDGFTDVATTAGIQRSPLGGFGPGAMLEPPRMPNGTALSHHIFDLLEFACDIGGCNAIDIDTGGVYVDINRDESRISSRRRRLWLPGRRAALPMLSPVFG